jgi:hypothetical protein
MQDMEHIKLRNPFPTCKKTRCVFITKTNRLILFSATMPVYPAVTRNKHTLCTKWRSVNAKAGPRTTAERHRHVTLASRSQPRVWMAVQGLSEAFRKPQMCRGICTSFVGRQHNAFTDYLSEVQQPVWIYFLGCLKHLQNMNSEIIFSSQTQNCLLECANN